MVAQVSNKGQIQGHHGPLVNYAPYKEIWMQGRSNKMVIYAPHEGHMNISFAEKDFALLRLMLMTR